MGGGGGSHQTQREGLGACKGTTLLRFPTACPPRDAFTELPEGLKNKKKNAGEGKSLENRPRKKLFYFFNPWRGQVKKKIKDMC